MGRRREEPLINVLISLPWWVSAIGVAVILVLRHVWLAWAEGASGMYAPIARQMHWLFYAMAGLFAFGAFASLIRQAWNGRMLEHSHEQGSLESLDWREFERLIQEAFRRKGYLSVETQSGADGGYDVGLRKDGALYLVQCKHWKKRQVGVAPVRELWGVIAARGAAGGFFVTSGTFTADAKAFAAQVKLELIDGRALKRLIGEVQRNGVKNELAEPVLQRSPICPKCGSGMVKRVARKGANAGKEFWGCSEYPRCRGVAN